MQLANDTEDSDQRKQTQGNWQSMQIKMAGVSTKDIKIHQHEGL
jgi:hypothetical protein